MKHSMTALALAALFSGALVTTAANATPVQAQQEQQMMQQQQNIEINDDMLNDFVDAMGSVQQISNKYAEQFQNAEDAEQAQQIQRKAQEEMVAAVEESGLTAAEYNAIVQRVQQDEELRAKLQEMTE
ncbi:DUF4168 domain-containing protein [Pseudidiomarina sp. PP-1MA]|uniref:DUF4168 domain-containing protein n=1 Tax=Pseudidiomarina sp. PP-1MA TaxID=3237706 RepID=A0AB39X8V0_9GAMM